ncbi:rhodanese-like domain-containing protein [Pirellulaceae bacterium SH467]|jgi:rhodanese-related sulfurtransferase
MLRRKFLYISAIVTSFSTWGNIPTIVADNPPPAKKELKHTADSLEQVKERIEKKKAVLVDVRELVEWNNGHIAGAVHLPWRGMQEKPDAKKYRELIPEGTIAYTYCEVGYRSLKAGTILEKYGIEVRPLKPGYKELVAAGFKSEK